MKTYQFVTFAVIGLMFVGVYGFSEWQRFTQRDRDVTEALEDFRIYKDESVPKYEREAAYARLRMKGVLREQQ